MEAAGFGRFSVFGYSFTGAFAPWLAHLTDRVDAVVSGGFPIVGDYSPQYADIQARMEAARADPAAWSEVTSRFDNRAALGFYRELSELPPNFLVRFEQSAHRGSAGCVSACRGCLWSGAGSNRRPSAFQVNCAERDADLRKR